MNSSREKTTNVHLNRPKARQKTGWPEFRATVLAILKLGALTTVTDLQMTVETNGFTCFQPSAGGLRMVESISRCCQSSKIDGCYYLAKGVHIYHIKSFLIFVIIYQVIYFMDLCKHCTLHGCPLSGNICQKFKKSSISPSNVFASMLSTSTLFLAKNVCCFRRKVKSRGSDGESHFHPKYFIVIISFGALITGGCLILFTCSCIDGSGVNEGKMLIRI